MRAEISDLKNEVKKLRTENKCFKKSLEEANQLLNSFKKILTKSQMKKMAAPGRFLCILYKTFIEYKLHIHTYVAQNVRWNWLDTSNAICLRASGPGRTIIYMKINTDFLTCPPCRGGTAKRTYVKEYSQLRVKLCSKCQTLVLTEKLLMQEFRNCHQFNDNFSHDLLHIL